MNVATFPPPSLQTQLAELKREKEMRRRVYPSFIAKGTLRQRDVDFRNGALDGAIATIESLIAAKATE